MKINNITILGDSILKCVVYDKETTKYKSTGDEKFNKLSEALLVNVNNLSRLGLTAKRAYDKEMYKISNETDLIILGLGGNDCDYIWKEISEEPDIEHDNNTPPAEFKSLMITMINYIRSNSIKVALMTLPPISSDKYFEKLSVGLNKDNLIKWIKDVNQIYRTQEFYSNTVRDIAVELNVPLIDVRGNFLVHKDNHKLIGSDGIHMNEAGYDLMIDVLIDYIKKFREEKI